jgi:hypothetical protein
MTEDKKTGKQLDLRFAVAYRRLGTCNFRHDIEPA